MKRLLELLALLAVPGMLFTCAALRIEQAALLTLVTVVLSLLLFFLRFEHARPRPRDILPIVVLASLAAAGRVLFAALPNVKPVTAIVIVAGVCLGRQGGFLTGALAALASNLFFGQGPWTPWQMYAWGVIGYLAGLLRPLLAPQPKSDAAQGLFRLTPWRTPPTVYLFGFFAALLYGFLLDSWYITGYISPLTWQAALAGYAAGLPFSLLHAVATVLFLLPIYAPWCRKIARIQRKYGISAGET